MDVRPATPQDLPALTDLYNHYVEHSHVTFDDVPFTLAQRRPWLEHYGPSGPYRLLVAVEADRLLGYATSSPFRPKPCYRSSVETTVYVQPDAGGRGVGTALYDGLFRVLADEPVHRAYAGVALPNPASEALHRRFGFAAAGTFTQVGYKHGRYHDVRWFERGM